MADGAGREHPHSLWPAVPPPVYRPGVVEWEHECVYLPGRLARVRAYHTEKLPAGLFCGFLDAGFRRSGLVIYQPICPGCRACVAIRVPTGRFQPSRSQRRCLRRNADLRVSVGQPQATDEKYELYRRYLAGRFPGGPMSDGREEYEQFLYESPVETIECCYRDAGGRLLAVGICDVCSRSLSSVYFYFEPSERRRGLGTYGALYEIELARRAGIPWYYLGYWVKGCGAMEYKSRFRPYELLRTDGVWREEG